MTHRNIQVRLPADLEASLAYIKDEQEARFRERGFPSVNLSDEAIILSCISGMCDSYQLVGEAGLAPGAKRH